MPQYGSSLYYDLLTGDLGKERFVDAGKILSLLGLKWLRWTPRGLRALLKGDKQPMINLPYLLQECVQVCARPGPPAISLAPPRARRRPFRAAPCPTPPRPRTAPAPVR